MLDARVARQRVHGGQQRWQRRDGVVLDFSVDVNPYGFPDSVRDAILSHVDDLQRYPDPEAGALRRLIAERHRLPCESVLPGNGSAELIPLIVQALRPTRAVVIAPTFTEYEWALECHGLEVRYVLTEEREGFALPDDEGAWAASIAGADLVFLCNPNNPTGTAVPQTTVRRLARYCEEAGASLVVDEAFVEWTEEPSRISVAPWVGESERLIVLRSLTKLFAVPGLRLGYLLAHPNLVERLRAYQSAWPLNTFALAVGEQLLRESAYVERSRALVRQSSRDLFKGLRALPSCHPFPSTVNFVLSKLTAPHATSSIVCRRLADRGILIRNCDDFTGLEEGRFIRLAVRKPEDHARLLAALREALSHVG